MTCTCTLTDPYAACSEHDNRPYDVRSEEESKGFAKRHKHLRCSCEECYVKYWNIEKHSTDQLCNDCALRKKMEAKPPKLISYMDECHTRRFYQEAECS
jgi:hypothetical protein|tara:strand:+ start:3796 stop:4092 length:297 start_codon:yes stop_codon:yes gene_type:complete